MSLLNDRTHDMLASGEQDAIGLLGKLRDTVDDAAAWNTLFDAQVYLLDRSGYDRACATGTLADQDGA